MSLVSVTDVTKRFGRHVGVADVTVELARGESVVLLGANGAGKTTLIRILASLSRPTDGSVTVDGVELTGGDPGVRSRIGVLSHETMLYDDLTARENLRLHARLHGVDDEACERWLDRVGLAERGSDRVRGFSHGMAKRLALARALLHDPDVLLLDEPYSGLDQDSLERVESILAGQGGRTLLASTHDLARGLALADRLLVLHRGRLVADVDGTDVEDVDALAERYRELTGGTDGIAR